jgi:hypothetical protein
VINDHSPLQILNIRKKFAKDLAEREFFKSQKYEAFRLREGVKDDMGMIQARGYGMSHAGQYSIDDLAPNIQKCLEPMAVSKIAVKKVPVVPLEEVLTRDDDNEINTIVLKQGGDLIAEKRSLKKKASLE